jgi:hypothetical protein
MNILHMAIVNENLLLIEHLLRVSSRNDSVNTKFGREELKGMLFSFGICSNEILKNLA